MTDRQLRLLDFVIKSHGNQTRKYTGDPYWFHLYRVGQMANTIPLGLEIGLCHDLFEDTDIVWGRLETTLLLLGYNDAESEHIFSAVNELTDEFTKENYPNLNRKNRKEFEAKRLWGISPQAQTVKYCDIIDNISSIVEYDPDFAKTYIEEKKLILSKMDKGEPYLYLAAKALVGIV